MSGLLSAIPGLSAHQVEIPEPVIGFDVARADELLRQLNGSIGAAYPDEGCISWLAQQPEIWRPLCDGENDVDRAYLQQDMQELEKAVDRLERLYKRAFDRYMSRPPVIEVQETLL